MSKAFTKISYALCKTRDVEIKHVTKALKAEQERENANNSNNDNLSGDKLKKLLSIYPIHKGMNYYRTYISESKIAQVVSVNADEIIMLHPPRNHKREQQ